MTTAKGAQGFGFDAWIQPFREAMQAFQPSAWPGAGAMPGMAWPGMGAWPAQAMGQMPGMANAAMGGFPPSPFPPGPFSSGLFSSGPLSSGAFAPGMAGPFAGMLEQISAMAQGQWQQLAGQFANGVMNGGDAMSQWRKLLETMVPAAAAFDASAMRGMGADGLRDALATPPVGPLREHVERWQKAMLAQLDYQEAAQAFSAQMGEIMKLALSYYERRLAACAEPGQSPASMRTLFDEWIEAGEQAWAERAGSDAFVSALGRYTNAQLRVRAAMADQINRMAESLGLPTRGEVDAGHRRIAMLERELRRVRTELDALQREPAVAQPAPVAVPKARPASAVVPIRPEVIVPADDTPAPVARPRRAKAAKKTRAQKSASRAALPEKPKKPERPAVSAAVLPIVAAPRAIGAAALKPARDAAPRRRAGK